MHIILFISFGVNRVLVVSIPVVASLLLQDGHRLERFDPGDELWSSFMI